MTRQVEDQTSDGQTSDNAWDDRRVDSRTFRLF